MDATKSLASMIERLKDASEIRADLLAKIATTPKPAAGNALATYLYRELHQDADYYGRLIARLEAELAELGIAVAA